MKFMFSTVYRVTQKDFYACPYTSMWAPVVARQISKRYSSPCHVFISMWGVISSTASMLRCLKSATSWTVTLQCWQSNLGDFLSIDHSPYNIYTESFSHYKLLVLYTSSPDTQYTYITMHGSKHVTVKQSSWILGPLKIEPTGGLEMSPTNCHPTQRKVP
jgi:hypothetical protein